MEGISDIRITGMDEKRPPRMRREPYIDLVFRLSHKAPLEWCRDFVSAQTDVQYEAKINTDECLFIETWVRTPEEIAGHLDTLKAMVAACNARYIENVAAHSRERDKDHENLQNEIGTQGHLNRIIAGLDFSES